MISNKGTRIFFLGRRIHRFGRRIHRLMTHSYWLLVRLNSQSKKIEI